MKTSYFRIFALLLSIFLLQKSNAQQKIIKLKNPSFEDAPRPAQSPLFWDDCAEHLFPLETPPDIHPLPRPESYFGVNQPPADGTTYVGLVVRSNESWESIGQKLEAPLQSDSCYIFSIALSSSSIYESYVRGRMDKVNFTDPIKLRIWGGENNFQKQELLAESNLIEHSEWKKYTFNFSPKKQVNYITFEAFFNTPTLFPPNGNILLDNASDIVLVNCDGTKLNPKISNVKPPEIENNTSEPLAIYKKMEEEDYLETIARIKKYGASIKFRNNKLGISSQKRLVTMANEMRSLSDYKLIIDFGGLKTKHAKIRYEEVRKVLFLSALNARNYEIRNSKEEDGDVEWLFGKDSFYIGILKKKIN